MRFHRRWRVLRFLPSLIACLNVSCGGGPTAPEKAFSPNTWTVNADRTSLHVARFIVPAPAEAQLDFWRGPAVRDLTDLRVRSAGALEILLQLNSLGQPIYFQDPRGPMLWVNDYLADGSADVTVANPRFRPGDVWRGQMVLPDAVSIGSSTSAELSSVMATFCSPAVDATLSAINASLCQVNTAAAILSSGRTLSCPGQLSSDFDAQVCSYLRLGSMAAADPRQIVTDLLSEADSPIPMAPEATVAE